MKKFAFLFAFLLLPFVFSGCSTEEETFENGKIVVEEFSDIECPFCKQLHPVLEKLKKDFPEAEFRYKYFPLEQIHKRAFPAAVAVECVKKNSPEKFENYLSEVYAAANLEDGTLFSIATKNGVDAEKFSACVKNQETANMVKNDMKEGTKRGVQGTPTIFINGKKVEQTATAMSYEGLFAAIKAVQ